MGSRGLLAATPAQGGSSRTPVELFQPSDRSHPEKPALGWMAPLKNTCSHFKEKKKKLNEHGFDFQRLRELLARLGA